MGDITLEVRDGSMNSAPQPHSENIGNILAARLGVSEDEVHKLIKEVLFNLKEVMGNG